jgi:GH15 family glucan-1,4-alpha-glucosidase
MTNAPPLPRQPATLELAPIGNCTVSALVDQSGSIVWCCMPRFDSSPVFDALLQSAQGLPLDGAMTVELESLARIEQAYDRGTAIVRTRLWDDSGNGIETVDFAPRFLTRDRVFRPAQLVRRVRPLALAGGIDETAREFEEQTALYWRHWSRRLAMPLEWQDAVIRAAITLKLSPIRGDRRHRRRHDHQHPRSAHSGRNWDYRYCWLRDAFFVVRALNSLAEVGTMETTCAGCTTWWLGRKRAHPAAVRHRAGALAARIDRCARQGLPRHGPGARGQPGAGAFSA